MALEDFFRLRTCLEVSKIILGHDYWMTTNGQAYQNTLVLNF